MNHSLHRANRETHVRIVTMSLVAGIAVVVGALNMKSETPVASQQKWTSNGVIKASRQAVYSTGERHLVR